jgi:hypothetical protein
MARRAETPTLSSGEARYVLERLIDEGKVTARDVREHVGAMWEEMNFIEKRLSELRGSAIGQTVAHPVRTMRRAAKKIAKKTRKLSAKTRASYQLQGQYLGYMRQIPERQRAKYKKMAKAESREAAVAAMKKALGK